MGTFLFTEEAQAVTTAERLTPFQDALPIPPVLTRASHKLTISQTTHQFHSALGTVPVWGYNTADPNLPPNQQKLAGYLGPTIEARKNTRTDVEYTNALPRKHLLNVDPTITQMKGKPLNSRILTHLHGGHISDTDDGNPYASPDIQTGPTPQTVHYANDQEAAHLWYHDHALGITRLNVMAGLAGVYLLREASFGDNGNGGNPPTNLGRALPSGMDGLNNPCEVPLVIQDRAFAKDGRIKYPAQWTPEFFGDVVCVNGKAWLEAHRRAAPVPRMRILNGSNSRFYNLGLTGGGKDDPDRDRWRVPGGTGRHHHQWSVDRPLVSGQT